ARGGGWGGRGGQTLRGGGLGEQLVPRLPNPASDSRAYPVSQQTVGACLRVQTDLSICLPLSVPKGATRVHRSPDRVNAICNTLKLRFAGPKMFCVAPPIHEIKSSDVIVTDELREKQKLLRLFGRH